MAEIAYFVYCDSIEELEGGKINVVNPSIVLNPLYVPGMYSYSVSLAIRDINTEDNELQIILRNEAGEIVNDTGIAKIPLLPEKNAYGSPLGGLRISIDFRNVPFKKNGKYCSTVMLNGEKLGEFPIFVQQANGGDGIDTEPNS